MTRQTPTLTEDETIDRICDFLLNGEEHCPDEETAAAELGAMIEDPDRAEKIVAAWHGMPSSDPRWRKMRLAEPFDRTLRTWLRGLPQC